MKKKRYLFFFSTAICLLAAGCSPGGRTEKILKVGVRDDIQNFSFYNSKADNYYGLEPDIAQELAERLNYSEVEFVTVQPETRKQTLLDGKVDCLIAVYSITDTRTENFDFSDAYYTDEAKILVEKSSKINLLEDLKGKTIGVLNGANTAPELAIKMHELGMIAEEPLENTEEEIKFQDLTIRKFAKYSEINDALETGEVDAACMDGCIAQTYMEEDREYLEIELAEQKYGVATQKGSELSGAVGEAIQEMLDDGTIEKLIDKWN